MSWSARARNPSTASGHERFAGLSMASQSSSGPKTGRTTAWCPRFARSSTGSYGTLPASPRHLRARAALPSARSLSVPSGGATVEAGSSPNRTVFEPSPLSPRLLLPVTWARRLRGLTDGDAWHRSRPGPQRRRLARPTSSGFTMRHDARIGARDLGERIRVRPRDSGATGKPSSGGPRTGPGCRHAGAVTTGSLRNWRS